MIKWEEDFGEYPDEHTWLGYLGKVIVAMIGKTTGEDGKAMLFNVFNLTGACTCVDCTKLSSAKRSAERALKRFMKDAGLTKQREI